MKLIKTLLATTLTLAAASTFAAPTKEAKTETEERAVVTTQEQPETQAATDATVDEATPASEPVVN